MAAVYCLYTDGLLALTPTPPAANPAVFLPDMCVAPDQPALVTTLLCSVFPDWTAADVAVKQLTGGITNMLLECTHGASTVLVRTYGQGTDVIIDRDREFALHLLLHLLGLAPPLFARFANGLVYGYLPGRALEPSELAAENMYPHIAARLGQWHRGVESSSIQRGIDTLKRYGGGSPATAVDVWLLLEEWVALAPSIQPMLELCRENRDVAERADADLRTTLQAELAWARGKLEHGVSPSVTAHGDLLSGNVIVGSGTNPVAFIDYEYMMPAPRAYDIANHLVEWQGFDCDRSRIPEPRADNPVLRQWCAAYLGNETEVDGLITELQAFYGLPGFYWGVWASIQLEISKIDFDYASYSKLRMEEYWKWKREWSGSHN